MLMTNVILMAPPKEGGGGGFEQLIFLGLIVLVFYFFMIRPQLKKAKEQKKYRESLQKGDKVVTIGGIHGKIAEIADATFVIEVEGGMKLRVEKSAVSMDASGLLNNSKN